MCLWFTNAEGFRQQIIRTEFINGDSKDQHEEAKRRAMLYYKGRNPEIVSVKYQ